MGITKTSPVLPTMLSPLGKACARMDLTAVHDILLKTGYKDEEGAENEVRLIGVILNFFVTQTFLGTSLVLATYKEGLVKQEISGSKLFIYLPNM